MQPYIEFVGYLASALVLVSLMMSSLLKLRLINLVGGITFLIYGMLIHATPIVIVNVATMTINLFYLYRMYTNKEYFKLLKVSSSSEYLLDFLDFHRDDIKELQPEYRFLPEDNQLIIFILRNMMPAGLFIGKRNENGIFNIFLDYVIPAHRDSKIGQHLFYQSRFFQQHQIHKLISKPNSPLHEKYLQKMGFKEEQTINGQTVYYLTLQNQ
ncbi:MAG: YgjV family protein [Ardenticatenaceae bacterium]|nr:YgjV family protein [Anaerolineales bacterium]MCB8940459.1 YgjV family protein [Ardenticatenaceae bacterium]MCB8973475.1 YgjV family protein [Ardenticatenaceae bacterium]